MRKNAIFLLMFLMSRIQHINIFSSLVLPANKLEVLIVYLKINNNGFFFIKQSTSIIRIGLAVRLSVTDQSYLQFTYICHIDFKPCKIIHLVDRYLYKGKSTL